MKNNDPKNTIELKKNSKLATSVTFLPTPPLPQEISFIKRPSK